MFILFLSVKEQKSCIAESLLFCKKRDTFDEFFITDVDEFSLRKSNCKLSS